MVADGAGQAQRPDLNATIEDARLGAGISLGVAASAAVAFWLLREDDESTAGLAIGAGAVDGGVAVSVGRRW